MPLVMYRCPDCGSVVLRRGSDETHLTDDYAIELAAAWSRDDPNSRAAQQLLDVLIRPTARPDA